MSAELAKEIDVELRQMDELLAEHRALLDKCRTVAPDSIERSALIQAFYNGIENIFLRISTHTEGGKPHGNAWHQDLLKSMTTRTASRGSVLSPETAGRLSEYLAFRHVFRHSYTFQLRWEKMKPLILELEEVLNRLRMELASFLRQHEP